jgi:lycopene cyclase domain-containing protein
MPDSNPYLYLILHAITLSGPLALSFDRKVAFYKKWKALFPAILITATFFILWDIGFTVWRIWDFNTLYITGWQLFYLPIEEILFFITIPYACIFIYETLNTYIKRDVFHRFSVPLSYVLIIFFLLIVFFFGNQLYTAVTFSLSAMMLFVHLKIFDKKYLGRFYLMYLVHLIPFWVINGILTTTPVVLYNDAHNLGRMSEWLQIPWDDHAYSFLLLLMNVTLYELFKIKQQKI